MRPKCTWYKHSAPTGSIVTPKPTWESSHLSGLTQLKRCESVRFDPLRTVHRESGHLSIWGSKSWEKEHEECHCHTPVCAPRMREVLRVVGVKFLIFAVKLQSFALVLQRMREKRRKAKKKQRRKAEKNKEKQKQRKTKNMGKFIRAHLHQPR